MQAPWPARPGLGWCLCWALLGAGSGSGPLCAFPGEAQEEQLAFPGREGRREASAASPEPRRARSLSGEPPDAAAVLRLGRLRDAPEEGRRPPCSSPEEPPVAGRSLDGDCSGGSGREGQGSRAPRRAKRGFTYPGTLWCGAGNIAASYEELGEHREADRCCRAHDHCRHVIHPFTYKYGYRNYRWHTISHCDCDNQLKACLRAVNDTASRVVGQAFFNVIQVPCFTFAYKEHCVEPYLYMWCKNYSAVAVAVVQPPVLYEYGGEIIDGPVTRWTTLATPSLPRARQPATEAPEPPGATRPEHSPKRVWKGKDRKGRKKGRKSRKGKKKTGGKAKALPGVGAATASPKRLATPDVAKVDLETQAGLPGLGEGDPFNAILSDDPGRGTGLRLAKGDSAESKDVVAPLKGIPGLSSPAERFGSKRKGRGPKARGQPGSARRRDPGGRGDRT